MTELPKTGHHSKGATRRKVICEDCDQEREIILAPNKTAPARCAACSRKRAAQLWNGARIDFNDD